MRVGGQATSDALLNLQADGFVYRADNVRLTAADAGRVNVRNAVTALGVVREPLTTVRVASSTTWSSICAAMCGTPVDGPLSRLAEDGLEDSASGLVRINPEQEISDGRFAWANDLQSGTTGEMGDVVDLDGRPVFCIAGTGSLVEHATDLEETGYLTTGRIRFRTLEDKLFKYLRLRTDALTGSVSVSAVTSGRPCATSVSRAKSCAPRVPGL